MLVSNKSIETVVREILVAQLSFGGDMVFKNSAKIVDNLDADSLDVVEIIMALEERFEIEIEDVDAEPLITVSDVIEYIEGRLAIPAPLIPGELIQELNETLEPDGTPDELDELIANLIETPLSVLSSVLYIAEEINYNWDDIEVRTVLNAVFKVSVFLKTEPNSIEDLVKAYESAIEYKTANDYFFDGVDDYVSIPEVNFGDTVEEFAKQDNSHNTHGQRAANVFKSIQDKNEGKEPLYQGIVHMFSTDFVEEGESVASFPVAVIEETGNGRMHSVYVGLVQMVQVH